MSELGVLSKAEELGVFSKLEGAGAFSLAEKALPLIEKLKLLSIFEACLDIEAGFIFTFANTLLFTGPAIATLQITGFLPIPKGPGFVGELAFDAAVLAAGATSSVSLTSSASSSLPLISTTELAAGRRLLPPDAAARHILDVHALGSYDVSLLL